MKNWDDLRILLALSRYKTMTAAAAALDVNTATISRRLERMTAEIGTTLFVRRGNDWEASAGAIPYLKAAERLERDFRRYSLDQSHGDNNQRQLSLSIELSLAWSDFMPKIGAFLTEHPQISVDIHFDKGSVAIGEVDLKIGTQMPSSGRLVRSKVGVLEQACYIYSSHKSPAIGYADTEDEGAGLELCRTKLIGQFGTPRFRTPSLAQAVELMKQIPLVCVLPVSFAKRVPKLVEYEPGSEPTKTTVWAIYHESRRLDPDIRLAIDFAKCCFGNSNSAEADL